MFTLNAIKKELLDRYNEDVDLMILEKCVHIWNIEPAIKDQKNRTFYDENSLEKIYHGIQLKRKGYKSTLINKLLDKIIQIKNSRTSNPIVKTDKVVEISKQTKAEVIDKKQKPIKTQTAKVAEFKTISKQAAKTKALKNKIETNEQAKSLSIDNKIIKLYNDTIVPTLTKSISEKISNNVVSFFKGDEFLNKLIELGSLKRDNEVLSRQVEELLELNSGLEDKVFNLEMEKRRFKKFLGCFYIHYKS